MIHLALEKLKLHGCEHDIRRPPLDENELTLIEKILQVTLPPSYRYFLCHAQTHRLHFEEFLWPGTDRDLVATNIEERSTGLPIFLLSFMSDSYGTQICFDMRHRNADGECPVVEWELGMREDHQFEYSTANLATWIIKTLEQELVELREMNDE
jgi:hypothetical protein